MAGKRDDSKGLSIRAYAEHRRARGLPGGQLSAVQRAIQHGRIHRNASGKIDPAQADQDWERLTPPAPAPVPARGPGPSDPPQPAVPPDRLSYQQSRAVREAYEARLRRLQYEVKSGALVKADDVKLEAFRRARSLRDRMMVIPGRVAGTLAGETDPLAIERALTEAITQALEAEAGEP